MSRLPFRLICCVILAALPLGCPAGHDSAGSPEGPRVLPPDFGVAATFSIVAVDPATGVCGAAVASKYPAVGEAVPFVRGGVGAFCTQYYLKAKFGPRALEMLAQDKPPGEILAELLRDDDRPGTRQLAIVDRHGRTAQHNPIDAGKESQWWGAASGRFYACQGNTLVGAEVITAMAEAYETTAGSLADRLLAALVAGDCAGGDRRGRLAAGLVVDKPLTKSTWLSLQVDDSNDAVLELAQKYVALAHDAKGEWSRDKLPWKHPCPKRAEPQPPDCGE
jgi:uncharacterized Ntn-hydrolase superfamily protein